MPVLDTILETIGKIFKVAFPLILEVAQQLADAQVKGEDLNAEQKGYLYTAYIVINVNFDELVKSTGNTYDDETLPVLSDFCKDTLAEGGIIVPEIPEELKSLSK